MTPREEIALIDQQIDANRAALMSRLHVHPQDSHAVWQMAWNRCPDLWVRENELFRQRGLAQEFRDAADHMEWKTAQRKSRRARAA